MNISWDLKHFISSPLKTNNKLSISKIVIAIFAPEFRLVLSYLIYSLIYKRMSLKLGYIMYLWAKRKYASEIHPQSKIGKGLRLGHHMGIVIGPEVVIGDFLYIFNDVTLGNKNVDLTKNLMPLIGNSVIIGTGSKILGPVSTGHQCVIGANSTVLHSFSENSIIVGSPATSKQKI